MIYTAFCYNSQQNYGTTLAVKAASPQEADQKAASIGFKLDNRVTHGWKWVPLGDTYTLAFCICVDVPPEDVPKCHRGRNYMRHRQSK